MSVTNIRPLRTDEPLELRQACLDVLEWSVLLAVLEHSHVNTPQTVTDIATKLRQQFAHPSSQVRA